MPSIVAKKAQYDTHQCPGTEFRCHILYWDRLLRSLQHTSKEVQEPGET